MREPQTRLVYLDTADLIAIADAKVDVALVARVFDAFEHSGATLVVSLWHVVDVRKYAFTGRTTQRRASTV